MGQPATIGSEISWLGYLSVDPDMLCFSAAP
jgi:hypothetical protein